MNLKISVLFRAIPLLMGAICLGFGFYVRGMGIGDGYLIAGNVLISLTAICIALFSTAATIIRQIIKRFNKADRIFYPILGYAAGIVTFICGITLAYSGNTSVDIVSGNVVSGVGLIACCVATVAISSGKFSKITENSSNLTYGQPVGDSYSKGTYAVYFSIPVICTAIALIRGVVLLAGGSTPFLVAGHVMIGLGLICACLIALVATILRQIQNTFSQQERWKWSIFVAVLGTVCLVWGILLMIPYSAAMVAPGFVLIGLGMICYSISSKVLLLASVWRRSAPLAKRIPMIPVITALSCLFLAAFLFEASYENPSFFVPAHIIVGLGAVCFTLFAIVSILESGTSKSS
ncbi:membrane protein [Christensenellaceae bacterium]|nr:membrane protein [Christensenellaceae bacterium]BDF60126.1 membrane protein [Christensenellaceae bacterium]